MIPEALYRNTPNRPIECNNYDLLTGITGMFTPTLITVSSLPARYTLAGVRIQKVAARGAVLTRGGRAFVDILNNVYIPLCLLENNAYITFILLDKEL